MAYTESTQSKITESFLLLRNALSSTKQQAENLFNTYDRIQKEFGLQNKRILELGAGSRGALITLFDDSNDVVGIDLYLGALDQGLWKAVKTGARKILFDPFFNHHLKACHGRPPNTSRKVLNMDATSLDFPDNSFDFVYSRYFMEHIEDVDKVASECARVLKPGGTSYHVFALYTLLDGAHTLDWTRYEPWAHLYSQVPGNAYVNKYRLQKYRGEFDAAFGQGNVEFRLTPSDTASRYMTPEIRAKLSDYADEELLINSPEIIAHKQY
jgi:ubiquinone/menaquinone biosynthesis C-methylase UbiE